MNTLKRTAQVAVIGAVATLMVAAVYVLAVPGGKVSAQADDAIVALKQQGEAFAAVSAKATPAVVFVRVEREAKMRDARGREIPFEELGPRGEEFYRRFFPRGEMETPQRQIGQGSGFFISEDGYLLTNNHVVGGADEVTVFTNDGDEYEANVIGTDPHSDIALIKV